MLSQPDEFTLNVAEWAAENRSGEPAWTGKDTTRNLDLRESRDAIGAAMKELEAAGYLSRFRVQDDQGRWGWEFQLREFPIAEDGSPLFGPSCGDAEDAQVTPKTPHPTSGKASSNKEEQKDMNTQKTQNVQNRRIGTPDSNCQFCEGEGFTYVDNVAYSCSCVFEPVDA